MNWASFFIGLLVGWLTMWLVDLFFWRRRDEPDRQKVEALQLRLDRAEAQVLELKASERGWEACRQRLATAEATIEELEAKLSEAKVEAGLRAPKVDLEAELPEAEVEVEGPGFDLDAAIEGLKAKLPDVDIDGAVRNLRAKIPNVDLDIGKFVDGLKAELPDVDLNIGAFFAGLGARLPKLDLEAEAKAPEVGADLRGPDLDTAVSFSVPVHRDNLRRIEGIGPQIAELLYDAGLLSFAQLAEASVDHLEEVLDRAGPRFRLAEPTTWPEQARLAANGKWDELQKLQDELSGGRARPSGGARPA